MQNILAVNMCIILNQIVFVMVIATVYIFITGSPLGPMVDVGIVLGAMAPFIITAIICIVMFLYIYRKNRRYKRLINEQLQEDENERVRTNNNVRETAEITVSDACMNRSIIYRVKNIRIYISIIIKL